MLLERRIALAIAALAIIVAAGCTDAQDRPSRTASVANASPTPRPTPNPDQASGLVMRFYRDIAAGTKQSVSDLATMVSRDFLRNHHDDFMADYGFISEPKVQIRAAQGDTVGYTLDYVYTTKGGGKLFWERSGHWTLNHGARSGWVLDNDAWDSVHLVAISTRDHPDAISVQDKVYSDGRHEFTYQGQPYSFLAKGDSWHISALATPAPAATAEAYNGGSSDDSASGYQQTPVVQSQAPPITASADCEEVSVEDIYDDGKILALDDGRHLSVADYDTVTSSVWVAPFDGLICNGDRFINKDDNEAVDLAD